LDTIIGASHKQAIRYSRLAVIANVRGQGDRQCQGCCANTSLTPARPRHETIAEALDGDCYFVRAVPYVTAD
jgi:hypothetical protein